MDIEVNIWAVLAAAASAMVLGGIWYAKGVFGKEWMRLAGIKDDKTTRKEAPKAMAKALAMALLMAYILSHLIVLASAYFPERSATSVGLSTAFWVWLGFVFAQVVMQDGFERRPSKLTAINVGYSLVSLLIMGWLISTITY